VQLYEMLHDAEAKAQPARPTSFRLLLPEALEHVREQLRRDARACIRNRQSDHRSLLTHREASGLQRTVGMNPSRRALLRGAGLLILSWPLPASSEPTLLSVRAHGARGNGKAKDTAAIQGAIDAAAPGDVVFFPPGDYLSGTLRLRSRLLLRLATGAMLIASPDDADFDRYEKLEYKSFADRETADFTFALLQGRRLQHVSIIGPGRIDGNRRSRGGPKLIAFKQCRHVTIHGLTLENAPNYNISLLGCDHVDIRGVTIRNGYSDGIDPDCCRHVRIAGCRVESRDDAIVLKASLALGVRRSTEYVVVTDCDLVNIRNGLKIGTESSGTFKDIVFRNCTLSGRVEIWDPPPFDVRPFPSAGVSIQNVDGGRLEQVVVSGITMRNVRAPIFVRLGERGWGQPIPKAGELMKIRIFDLVATGAEWTSSIMGVPGHDVSDIALSNIRISGKGGGDAALVSRPVPQRKREYPDAARFRNLPAQGLYCRHVTRLRVERTALTVDAPDHRPALVLDDVRDVTVKRLVATAPSGAAPVAWLRSTQDCLLDDIRSPGADTLARLSGAETARVRVVAGVGSAQVVVIDPDVDSTALRTGGSVIAGVVTSPP
jgi:Glycosyl hydrolases family 28/Pectate lyase superfamily protein